MFNLFGRVTSAWILPFLLSLAILNSYICFQVHHLIFSGPELHDVAGPRQSTLGSTLKRYSCGYRAFPYPERHSGLPWLYDAFASNTTEYAVFVGMHRGAIDPQFNDADYFFANETSGRTHQFLCMFQGTTPVMSDQVHPIIDGTSKSGANLMTFLIHCKIPTEYRYLIVRGQKTSALHVDLYALYDAEDPSQTARNISAAPKISSIAICHPANLQPQQFTMIAHTRIRSNYKYYTLPGPDISENHRIPDWIEYHNYQGFDHFVIVDNDHFDHGPLEHILQPYIDSGLVTRIWNPMNESAKHNKPFWQTCHAQGGASISALHRFGFATEYFANMDIDEYFVPSNRSKSVLAMTQELLRADSELDALKWPPRVMTHCDGVPVEEGTSELSKRCKTTNMQSGPKSIFLADRIWLYHTHHLFLSSNWTQPKFRRLGENKEGYLAHFRRQVTPYKKLDPATPVDHFDSFLEYQTRLKRLANASLI